MTSWTAIVAIILIGALTSVLSERYKAMGRSGSSDDQGDREREALRHERDEARSELADLRERVKVLERIATDGHRSNDLSDEIEKLRDR